MPQDLSLLARKIDAQGSVSQQAVKSVQREAAAAAAASQTQIVQSNSRLSAAIERLAAEIVRQQEGGGDDRIVQQLKLLTDAVQSLKEQEGRVAGGGGSVGFMPGGYTNTSGFALPSPGTRGVIGAGGSFLGDQLTRNTGMPSPFTEQGRDVLRSDSNQALGGASQMWSDYTQAIAQLKTLGAEMTQLGRAMGYTGDQATAAFRQMQQIGTGYGELAQQTAQHTQAIQQGRMLFGSPDVIKQQTQTAYTQSLSQARQSGTSVDQQIGSQSQRSMLNVTPEEFGATMSIALARANVTGQASNEMQQALTQLLQTQAGTSISRQGAAAIQGAGFLSNLYSQNPGNSLGIMSAEGVLNQVGQQGGTQGTLLNAYLQSIVARDPTMHSQFDIIRKVQSMTPEEKMLTAANAMFPGQDIANLSNDDAGRLYEQLGINHDNYQANDLMRKGLSGMTPQMLEGQGRQLSMLQKRFGGPGGPADGMLTNLVAGKPGSEQALEDSIRQQKGGADFLAQHPNTKGADLLTQYADTNTAYNPNNDKGLLSQSEQLANATAATQNTMMGAAASLLPQMIRNQQAEDTGFQKVHDELNLLLQSSNALLTPLNGITGMLGLVATATAKSAMCCGGGGGLPKAPGGLPPVGGGNAPGSGKATGETPQETSSSGRTVEEIGANKLDPAKAMTAAEVEAKQAETVRGRMGNAVESVMQRAEPAVRSVADTIDPITRPFSSAKGIGDLVGSARDVTRGGGPLGVAAIAGTTATVLGNAWAFKQNPSVSTLDDLAFRKNPGFDTLKEAGRIAGPGDLIPDLKTLSEHPSLQNVGRVAVDDNLPGRILHGAWDQGSGLLSAARHLIGHAAGGPVTRITGERGPEAVNLMPGDQVTPFSALVNLGMGDASKQPATEKSMQELITLLKHGTAVDQGSSGWGAYGYGLSAAGSPISQSALVPYILQDKGITNYGNQNVMPSPSWTGGGAAIPTAFVGSTPITDSPAPVSAPVPSVATTSAVSAPGSPSTGTYRQGAINNYVPMSTSQVTAFISRFAPKSPLLGHEQEILDAAWKNHMDPRNLLVALQAENNFGTSISTEQLAGNNFGGIKGMGNAPTISYAPASEGGVPYAAYKTVGDGIDANAYTLTHGPESVGFQANNIDQQSAAYLGHPDTLIRDPQTGQMAGARGVAYRQAVANYPAPAGETHGLMRMSDRAGNAPPAAPPTDRANLPGGTTLPATTVATAAGTSGPVAVSLPPDVLTYLKAIADSTQASIQHLQQIASSSGKPPAGTYTNGPPLPSGGPILPTTSNPYDGVFVNPRGRAS